MSRILEKPSREAEPDLWLLREDIRAGRYIGCHGYARLLGIDVHTTAELIERIESGLPIEALERFQASVGRSLDDVADLVQITRRTLSRRKAEGRLQPDESDRLVRASRVFGKALELFEGDAEGARRWLSSPQIALGNVTPWAMARSDPGARAVEDLIGRLEHGVFS